MEFMDHLYQFGQFGILTFRDGIQEVSGSIPLISTKNLRNLRISEVFLILRRENVAFYVFSRNRLTLI